MCSLKALALCASYPPRVKGVGGSLGEFASMCTLDSTVFMHYRSLSSMQASMTLTSSGTAAANRLIQATKYVDF